MRSHLANVFVDGQTKALDSNLLGFEPRTQVGPATTTAFDDTCGNLISIATQP